MRMQNYAPEYSRLNTRGVAPTLVHGDEVVTDSAKIVRYIDAHFDGPSLTPKDETERKEPTRGVPLPGGRDALARRPRVDDDLRPCEDARTERWVLGTGTPPDSRRLLRAPART